MKKINILQVFPAFSSGGVEEEALIIGKALAKQGLGSFIATSGGTMVKAAENAGINHICIARLKSRNPIGVLLSAFALIKTIKHHNIDIVHGRSRWPAWACLIACKVTQTPFITTFHGAHKQSNRFKWLFNSIMVRAPHVISISDYMTRYIDTYYGPFTKSRGTMIHTIQRGVDLDEFTPDKVSNEKKAELKNKWNLDEKKKTILLPARITRIKGHLLAIKALAKLKTKKWQAVFVGRDPNNEKTKAYETEILSAIQHHNLENRVSLQDKTHDINAGYALADLILIPSTHPEAFGRTVIESQAMGVPILASNIGAPADIIKDGETGWLFESGNSEILSQKIEAILSLNNLNDYKKHARKSVEENFTTDTMAKKTINIYRQITS